MHKEGAHRLLHGLFVGHPLLRLQDGAPVGRKQAVYPRQQRLQGLVPAIQVDPLGHAEAGDGVKRPGLQAVLIRNRYSL